MTNPNPSPDLLLSSTSTVFTPPLPSFAIAPMAPPPLLGGGPPALSSTPSKSRGSKVSVTGTESRKLVLWMRAEAGGPLGVCAGGAPGKHKEIYREIIIGGDRRSRSRGKYRLLGTCAIHLHCVIHTLLLAILLFLFPAFLHMLSSTG